MLNSKLKSEFLKLKNLSTDNRLEDSIQRYYDSPYCFQQKTIFSNKKKSAHLSFDPISKNLRMFASAVSFNWGIGRSGKLSNKARNGETEFVKNEYGWVSWYPWIYIRHLNLELNNIAAWSYYFNAFNSNGELPLQNSKITQIKKNTTSIEEELYLRFAINIASIKSNFILSEKSKTIVKKQNSAIKFAFDNVIGLQIRRGETVSEDETYIRPTTPAFTLEAHAFGVRALAEKLQTDKIYIATDSLQTIDKMSTLLPEFQISFSNIDRAKFYRVKTGQIYDMQNYIYDNPLEAPFYAYSAMTDLLNLSRCRGIVGKFSSEFVFTAWMLALAESKRYIPIFDLQGEQSQVNFDRLFLS